MVKEFTVSDIFVEAFFGSDGTLFIPHNFHVMHELDNENYHDKIKIRHVYATHEMIKGETCTYFISGNVLEQWHGTTRKIRAKNFAIWYHKNRGKLPVWHYNS